VAALWTLKLPDLIDGVLLFDACCLLLHEEAGVFDGCLAVGTTGLLILVELLVDALFHTQKAEGMLAWV
jgi:hypothetical protein